MQKVEFAEVAVVPGFMDQFFGFFDVKERVRFERVSRDWERWSQDCRRWDVDSRPYRERKLTINDDFFRSFFHLPRGLLWSFI